MKEVAKLQVKDRTELFQATAISMGMQSNVIEPLFEEFVDFDTFAKSDFRVVKIEACEIV